MKVVQTRVSKRKKLLTRHTCHRQNYAKFLAKNDSFFANEFWRQFAEISSLGMHSTTKIRQTNERATKGHFLFNKTQIAKLSDKRKKQRVQISHYLCK
jgi:hypothetical protein